MLPRDSIEGFVGEIGMVEGLSHTCKII
jgi:hypothetical protein